MPAPAFHVLIPARLASTRLPNKPLADIGGKPMIVRVAERVATSAALSCTVATDHPDIAQACAAHGIQALMTRADHPSGSDRLAEACTLLGWADDAIVVNVQGDEPLMDPGLIQAVAQTLHERPDCVMGTAAHALDSAADWLNPNVVKVVLDQRQTALYFSRAPIPWWRDGMPPWPALSQVTSGAAQLTATLPSDPAPLRHIGLYAYRAAYLRRFPQLSPAPMEQCEALEQLRVLWHGDRIAVHVAPHAPGPGVDTPEDLERVRRLWPAVGQTNAAQ